MGFNSLIADKLGECGTCKDGRKIPLTKGLCKMHYWNSVKLKSFNKRINSLMKDEDGNTELQKWYERIMLKEKAVCWNCGVEASWIKREEYKKLWHSSIAHILKKATFDSVKTNEFNYLILFPAMSGICSCHDEFDSSNVAAFGMQVFDIAKYRFNLFEKHIANEERRFIPSMYL